MEENLFAESYIVKETIDNINFYKCYCCPYMSFSCESMRFHIESLHLDNISQTESEILNKITIKCPGCFGRYHSENYFKKHLRNHHRMSSKDINRLLICLNIENHNKNELLINKDGGNNDVSLKLCKTPANSQYTQQDNKLNPKDINTLIKHQSFDSIECSHNVNREINYSRILKYDNSLSKNNTEGNENNTIHNLDYNVSDDFSSSVNTSNQVGENNKKRRFAKVKNSRSGRPNGSKSTGVSKFRKVEDEKRISEKFGHKCDVQDCGVRLLLAKNMSYHKSCHLNNTKELHCPECKLHFLTIETLHTHLWNQHRIDLELHTCDYCPYKVYSLHRLNNIHKKIHSDEKNYVCEICFKAFKNSKQLANHRPVHRKENSMSNKFICKICNRELNTNILLNSHMKAVHEKIKLYKCKMCNYSASVKSSLTVHVRLHTGEKPYECKECSFKSSTNSSLRRHMMRHSLQRRYKCDHCSYTCIQASSIKIHIKSKHPGIKTDLLHSCPHCSYTSVNKLNYKAHLFLHDNSNSAIAHVGNSLKTKTNKKVKSIDNIVEESFNTIDNNFSNIPNVNNKIQQIHIDLSDSNEIYNFNQPVKH